MLHRCEGGTSAQQLDHRSYHLLLTIQTVTFRFKHHKRRPEDKDFMVVLRIDGREFGRTIIGKNSHQPNNVEHFYTATVDAEGSQVIHSHAFQIMRAVSILQPPCSGR
jgi:hypothetical protein